jgi:translation initiation factor IF-2
MSGKTTIAQLAKSLKVAKPKLLAYLKEEGLDAPSNDKDALEADVIELLQEHFGGAAESAPASAGADKEIHLKPPIIVKDLAAALKVKANVLNRDLIAEKITAGINQTIDVAVAERLCAKRGYTLVVEKRTKQGGIHADKADVAPEERVHGEESTDERPPVITLIGHVDHGKTSLLDAIRRSNLTRKESGGITQHIGAWSVERNGHQLTFIDTPGHAAFENMRRRGAEVTDIVVLVVAADDGFMPQTIEGLKHVRAAGSQLVVAVNKMDLESANKDQILTQMQQNDLFPEDWGGDVAVVGVSATAGTGIDDLLDRLVLEAEMLELRANPKLPVKAIVIEAQVEQGLGTTTNVLIKNGTVKQGDYVICGQHYGKVKAIIDSDGKRLKKAGPSTPAKLVGLNGVPDCGSILAGCKNEREAKRLASDRAQESRQEKLAPPVTASLDDLFRQIKEESRKELKVIVKADVQGTAEAIRTSLDALGTDKIKLNIISSGVGSIVDKDVMLASASDAIVVGFHVRVNPGVNATAKREGVEIRLYSVIYELIEQMREALEGMLDPETREESVGRATILQVFETKKAKICGCSVGKGTARVGAKARVFRGEELIYNGSIASLRRFQDDVKEVKQGLECGIRLDNFNDFDVDDVIEIYDYVKTKATL